MNHIWSRLLIACMLLFFLGEHGQAQNQIILDSLYGLQRALSEWDKPKVWNALAQQYSKSNLDSSVYYADLTIGLQKDGHNPVLLVRLSLLKVVDS